MRQPDPEARRGKLIGGDTIKSHLLKYGSPKTGLRQLIGIPKVVRLETHSEMVLLPTFLVVFSNRCHDTLFRPFSYGGSDVAYHLQWVLSLPDKNRLSDSGINSISEEYRTNTVRYIVTI
jgi:hypothetical protein